MTGVFLENKNCFEKYFNCFLFLLNSNITIEHYYNKQLLIQNNKRLYLLYKLRHNPLAEKIFIELLNEGLIPWKSKYHKYIVRNRSEIFYLHLILKYKQFSKYKFSLNKLIINHIMKFLLP